MGTAVTSGMAGSSRSRSTPIGSTRSRLPSGTDMASFPFLDWPGPLAFAHQGAHAEGGPGENTMAAFEAAVALGYRYLETDAHVTADGVLVAFHDDRLDRLTDRIGVIGDLPWAEVGAAKVRGGEGVPLLEDLLTAWPDVRVNIDPKHDAAVDPLVELIRRTGTLDRVCFGAFSDKRLSRIQAGLGPGACTSMGPRQVARLVAAARRLPAGSFTAACVQVPTHQGRIPWSRPVSWPPPTPGTCRSTCGRSTTPPRCTACSTWGWTGS